MDDRAVDQIVRSALADRDEEAGAHPDPDTLFQYYAGELDDAEVERVRAHVTVCGECAEAVLDFDTYPHLTPPSEDDVPTAEQVDAGWAEVQARLAAEAGAETGASPGGVGAVGARPNDVSVPVAAWPPRPAPDRRTGARAWPALAATLAVAAAGLGAWVAVLHRSMAAPGVNVPIVDLPPEPKQPREGTTAPRWQPVRMPAGASRVVLFLTLASSPPPPPYSAEITADASDRPLWSNHEVQCNSVGAFSVDLSRGFLPAGRYRLTVRSGQAATPVAKYLFQLDYD